MIEGYEQDTDFVYKILPDFYITSVSADLQVLSYMFRLCNRGDSEEGSCAWLVAGSEAYL